MNALGRLAGQEAPAPAQPMAEPSAAGLFPGGPESLQTKFQKTFEDMVNRGATPNAAVDTATALTAAERKANTDSVKQVTAAREQADKLLRLADTAQRGMEGAGATGGFFGGIRDLASRAYATVNDEESTQRSFQALLDSVKPEVIGMARVPGAGATSDFEARAYLGAGPSSDKTKAENEVLIKKLRSFGELQRDYADFLETYVEEKGTTVGAKQLWDAYTKSNPLFDQQYNPMERAPWRDWVAGLNGQMPSQAGAQPQQGGAPTPPPGYEIAGRNPTTGKWQIKRAR